MAFHFSKAQRRRSYREFKLGQEPGSFLHASATEGAASFTAVPLTWQALSYSVSQAEQHLNLTLEQAAELMSTTAAQEQQWLWLRLEGTLTEEALQWLKSNLAVEALTLEDLLNQHQRTKVEAHAGYSYWVLHRLHHEAGGNLSKAKNPTAPEVLPPLQFEPVHLLLGERWLISLHPQVGGAHVFEPLWQKLLKPSQAHRFTKLGSPYLAYTLLDRLVDEYFIVHGTLEESLEVQEQLLLRDKARHNALQDRLYQHKRQLNQCRRQLIPISELVFDLRKEEVELHLPESLKPYLQDLQDHLAQLRDYNESLSEETDGFIAMYLSLVNYRSNEVMQTLTLVGTIFMPLTFIVGVYGMNFEHMPELTIPFGYPLCLGFMALVTLGCLAYFRKKHWL